MLNRITLKQIRAFIAVAQTGSFAEASQTLCISQPALSMSIKNLEEIVGGNLFIRTTRELALTPEGETFLPKAKRLIIELGNHLDELDDLFSLQQGCLSIAVMPSFATTHLAAVLRGFKKNYPSVKIKVLDVVQEEAIDLVKNNRAELCITFEPNKADDCEFVPLFQDEFVAAVPQNHQLAEAKSLTWQALTELPFIALNRPSNIRQLMETELQHHDLKLKIDMEANQLLTITKMVAAGLGVSVLPKIAASYDIDKQVSYVPLTEPHISRNIGIVVSKHHARSELANRFIEHLKQVNSSGYSNTKQADNR